MADSTVIGTATLKKKGDTGGVASGSGTPQRKPFLAVGGGSGTEPIPRKRRVIGSGEH